jgi:hypothetical protein
MDMLKQWSALGFALWAFLMARGAGSGPQFSNHYTTQQNFNFCLCLGRDYVHLIELIFFVKNVVFLDIV